MYYIFDDLRIIDNLCHDLLASFTKTFSNKKKKKKKKKKFKKKKKKKKNRKKMDYFRRKYN